MLPREERATHEMVVHDADQLTLQPTAARAGHEPVPSNFRLADRDETRVTRIDGGLSTQVECHFRRDGFARESCQRPTLAQNRRGPRAVAAYDSS
jgi:hypothetical protein